MAFLPPWSLGIAVASPSAPPSTALHRVRGAEPKRRSCRLHFCSSIGHPVDSRPFVSILKTDEVITHHRQLPSTLLAAWTHHRDPIKGALEHPISPCYHHSHHFTTSMLHVALPSSFSTADPFLLVAGQNQPPHRLHWPTVRTDRTSSTPRPRVYRLGPSDLSFENNYLFCLNLVILHWNPQLLVILQYSPWFWFIFNI
jgi:hypothetical protein